MHLHDQRAPRMTDDEAAELIAEYRRCGDPAIRNRVVDAHQWLAVARARRLMRRSETLDDLTQVASIGILKAAERFDPSFGVLFRSFAAITADGELRRYYRSTWRMRVPRSLQELALEVSAGTDHLRAVHHAAPSIEELAAHVRRPVKEVELAMLAGQNHSPASLEQRIDEGGDAHAAGADDPGLEHVNDRVMVEGLLDALPARLRRIVVMRFHREMTQAEIGAVLGISQVHVSRLLANALLEMRRAAPRGTTVAA